MKHPDAGIYPSRVPRTSGFLLRACFDDGADASLDDHFTPPAGVSAAFVGATGTSTVCFGAVGTTTYPDLSLAASLVASSAFSFVSISLAAVSYSTVILAFIASRAKSACAKYA